MLEKVCSKLNAKRKVNEANMLVKLGQKVFPNAEFQSEVYPPSSISTDAAGKLIVLRYVSSQPAC